MLHIPGKLQGIDALTAKFRDIPRVIEKATASALNKIGTQGVTAAKRGITDIYNIKAGDVAKAISRIPAKASYGNSQRRMWTTITARGGRLGIHKFGGRPAVPPDQIGVPVKRRKIPTVKILKEAGRRAVTPSEGFKPFVARMRTGFGGTDVDHVGIFVRTNKWLSGNKWRVRATKLFTGKRLRVGKHQVIRELKTKGIAESFASRGREALDRLLAEKGAEILKHELNYFFEKELKR